MKAFHEARAAFLRYKGLMKALVRSVFFLGLCLGIIGGVFSAKAYLYSDLSIVKIESPQRLACARFKTKNVTEAEEELLRADGYRPILYQERFRTFQGRSRGTKECTEVTTRWCWDTVHPTNEWLSNEYWCRDKK